MNDTNQDSTPENELAPAPQSAVKSPSRRRLIKLGTAGVPVVATLASSPAMAWHCRTASAWGSNMTGNLTASQKAGTGHISKTDECWAISNWCNNSARAETGISDKPWDALLKKCSSLYGDLKKNSRGKCVDDYGNEIKDSDRYKYVRVDSLCKAAGIVIPAGCGGASKAVAVLTSGDTFHRCIIVAQLNYLFPTVANQIQWCAKNDKSQNQLPLMATGSYKPNGIGVAWDKDKIVKYLQANYMSI